MAPSKQALGDSGGEKLPLPFPGFRLMGGRQDKDWKN